MNMRIARVSYAMAAAGLALAGTVLAGGGSAAAATTAPHSLGPPVYQAGLSGYVADGGRWFRFASTTVTVPPRSMQGSDAGTAAVMLQGKGSSAPAAITVRAGGGARSVVWNGGAFALAPQVGDQLSLSIYYDQHGHDVFTVSDITQHKTQAVNASVPATTYLAALVIAINSATGTPPAADTRAWEFTGTRLTTYTGVRGTITGPWSTNMVINTTSSTANGTIVASPSPPWNGGSNFGAWLRRLPLNYTRSLAGYEIWGSPLRFITTTLTVPAVLPDGIASGGAGMSAGILLGSPSGSAAINVVPGGGSGSVSYRIVLGENVTTGTFGLSPQVGDQLVISIYYDQHGGDSLTAADITSGSTQTVPVSVGSQDYSAARVTATIDNSAVTAPPSDISLWNFTSSRATNYAGVRAGILGPWRAGELIDTMDATAGSPVVMSAPVLWNGGQNFGAWLRHG